MAARGARAAKLVFAALAVGAILLPLAARLEASEPLDLYDTESAARQHCRGDTVVWLDVPSNRYWLKGEAEYGRTKAGGYTCKKDAIRSGNKRR